MVKVECLHAFMGSKRILLLTSFICEIKSQMKQWKRMLWHYSTIMPFFVPFVCTHVDTHKILVLSDTSVSGVCPRSLYVPPRANVHALKICLDDGKDNKGDLRWSN